MSADGMNVFADAPFSNDDGMNSGHARILRFKDMIMKKEHDWRTNQSGDVQDDRKVKLSTTESTGLSTENQKRCRESCLNQGQLTDGRILTRCEAVWGESSKK